MSIYIYYKSSLSVGMDVWMYGCNITQNPKSIASWFLQWIVMKVPEVSLAEQNAPPPKSLFTNTHKPVDLQSHGHSCISYN